MNLLGLKACNRSLGNWVYYESANKSIPCNLSTKKSNNESEVTKGEDKKFYIEQINYYQSIVERICVNYVKDLNLRKWLYIEET